MRAVGARVRERASRPRVRRRVERARRRLIWVDRLAGFRRFRAADVLQRGDVRRGGVRRGFLERARGDGVEATEDVLGTAPSTRKLQFAPGCAGNDAGSINVSTRDEEGVFDAVSSSSAAEPLCSCKRCVSVV